MKKTEERQFLLDTEKIKEANKSVLRQKNGHVVYRINTERGSYILKCFQTQRIAKEIQIYRLLQEYDVPTLPCYGMTDEAIALVDLDANDTWFLASEADMSLASTGIAVANWYRKLHSAGFEFLRDSTKNLENLHSWVEEITPQSLFKVGKMFSLSNLPVWDKVLGKTEILKRAYQSYPQTFNYFDFAMENLALSSMQKDTRQAIVFDYDNFSIGTICSDWRNVLFSLQGDARDGFKRHYGEVQENECQLDDVLGILHGLIVASNCDKFPQWALSLLKSFENGELDRKIQIVLEFL